MNSRTIFAIEGETEAAPDASVSTGSSELNALVARLYDELRAIARRHLARERPDHTLQTTALVNEAYMRLRRAAGAPVDSGAEMLAAASVAMRRILVDEARSQTAQKRGGAERRRVDLSVATLEFGVAVTEFIALHEALEKLAALDERKSRVVELRFFGGLQVDEIARLLGLTTRSVERDWQFARAWLFRELTARG